MITLRLDINDVNALYTSIERYQEDVGGIESNQGKELEELKNLIKQQAEKDVSTWDGYVVNEVNNVLELFLPESEKGNIGITYNKPILEEMGPIYDNTKAKGVDSIHW